MLVTLVGVAVALPFIMGDRLRGIVFAPAAPLFGQWLPHTGPGTVPSVLIAIGAVAVLPTLADRLRRRALYPLIWSIASAWTFSLALIDGWHRGFTDRLARPDEYLTSVPGVTDIGTMLHGFASRIPDFQPDSWPTHVSGSGPGALLTYVWLDRIGLGGGAWAGVVSVIVGASATVAVLVTLHALGADGEARRCAPFLALFPGAIWVGVSADGYFMGVTAWGVALIAVACATTGARSAIAAVCAGVVLGWAVFLSYGFVLIGVIVVAVLIAGRTVRPVWWAVPAAIAVAVAFALAGFWWLDGYHGVVTRYYQGIGAIRPFWYWSWANLAATALAIGPAAVIGLPRSAVGRWWTRPAAVLTAGALTALLIADLSALSKAETERIWLSFTVWLMVATAALPPQYRRHWLAAQAAVALAVNHLVLTYW